MNIIHDARFNTFFSFVVGIGLICILRPMCTGSECVINKPPTEADFDKHVYRMGEGKCYEFKTEIVNCPASGAIEAFKECSSKMRMDNTIGDMMSNAMNGPNQDQFRRRLTPIF